MNPPCLLCDGPAGRISQVFCDACLLNPEYDEDLGAAYAAYVDELLEWESLAGVVDELAKHTKETNERT